MQSPQNTVNRRSTSAAIYRIAFIGIMAGLSLVLMLVRFPIIPSAGWLEYDLGDIPILLTAVAAGPVPALITLLITVLIEMVTISKGGFWGMLMHLLATGSMALVLSAVFRKRPTNGGLIAGLTAAAITLVAVMIPMNLVITPLFMPGMSARDVLPMITPILLPFNLIKGLLHGLIVFGLYKATAPSWNKVRRFL